MKQNALMSLNYNFHAAFFSIILQNSFTSGTVKISKPIRLLVKLLRFYMFLP